MQFNDYEHIINHTKEWDEEELKDRSLLKNMWWNIKVQAIIIEKKNAMHKQQREKLKEASTI